MTWKRHGSSSYIVEIVKATGSCRGYCKDYRNAPRRKDGLPYGEHCKKFCPTCDWRFYRTDWSRFPNPSYCICCKKKMRMRKNRPNPKADWRPRVD